MRLLAFVLGFCSVLSACLLDDAPPPRAVQGRTLLAIEAQPAEALPGELVKYRVIVASPDGPESDIGAAWSYCNTPRPLSENAAVSVACAQGAEQPIDLSGLAVEAPLPEDACARFGPETSAGLRPADPDQSGGYYQPVRVALDGLSAVHRQRVSCALADAPFELVRRFQREYRRNRAPAILSLRAQGTARDHVTAGESTELLLELAPDTREHYLAYDRARTRLVERVERLDVRWFASAGVLEHAQSAAVVDQASVRWTPPARSMSAWVWAVLRDDRGGVTTWEQRLTID